MRTFWTFLKIFLFALAVFLIGLFAYLFVGWSSRSTQTTYGITWSKTYADWLGINSLVGLRATLDDLGVREFRIPAYWTEIEAKRGVFTFSWLDQQMDLIASRQGKVILSVGQKQPRWPECWVPEWAKKQSAEQRQASRLVYLNQVFQRYAHHPALLAWQVENEADFAFGECEKVPRAFTMQEMDSMRQLEMKTFSVAKRHPVYTTESGEFSWWFGYAGHVDGVGVSVYRDVIGPWGRFAFPIPSWFYARKAALIHRLVKTVYVSELQAEPWVISSIKDVSWDELQTIFPVETLKKNLAYAQDISLPRVHVWGAEWWYWMKKNGHPEYWAAAKAFFKP